MMARRPAGLATGLPIGALLGMQSTDGAWPSYAGKRAVNTEATALAVLALTAAGEVEAAERGARWLARNQRLDGSWSFTPAVDEPSWATSLVVLAMAERDRDVALRGARWLLAVKGRRLGVMASLLHRFSPRAMVVRMDPDLQGWPWRNDAASFVEPTAHALTALKRLRRELGEPAERRIMEAEALLYDRTCRGGGWNYGNSVVYDVDLPPYADATAIALIGLQESHREGRTRPSLELLRHLASKAGSGLALAWTALCLGAYGEHVEDLPQRLAHRYAETAFLGETKTLALAVLATHDPTALRL
ncbi:MAG TPA: prenyltransferase/squalene oxidase repeat-containing protein [Methylomirabilota bacterium]|jgi:hypothetical protein